MEKQEKILNSALKLLVEFGFHGTPTSKIAQEAGVSNGTLFHYYKTKDDLVVALYISLKKKYSGYINNEISKKQDTKDIFKTVFYSSLEWALSHKTEFQFIQQFHLSPYFSMISLEEVQKEVKCYLDLLQRAIDEKVIKKYPVDYIFTIVNSHIFGVFQYLTSNEFTGERKSKIVKNSFEIFWKMLT
jgi:AcrR family transcriptional regulator